MGKTLLVTGASSEIGRELIRAVGSEYTTVVAHYNNSANAVTELKNNISSEKLIPIQADFTDLDSTVDFAEKVKATGLVPDAVVHLSSLPLGLFSKFDKTVWEQYEKEFNVSFRSAVILFQKIMPLMAKRRSGKVVIMLSYNLLNTPQIKNASVYSTAKYALYGLMRSLSSEYAQKGVWVNGVSPSVVDTKFARDNMPEILMEQTAKASPIKRNLTPVDVIKPIKFLLSDDSDYITGQNLGITAGN